MIQWFTTAPNPRGLRAAHRGRDADDGQRGWRLHAIVADDKETLGDIAKRPAACGLIPSHGWGIDLFIGGAAYLDQRCKRCARSLDKEKSNG